MPAAVKPGSFASQVELVTSMLFSLSCFMAFFSKKYFVQIFTIVFL